MKTFVVLLAIVSVCTSCSITKPCGEAGDITWNPPVIGDKKCSVKKTKDGRKVLDGPFIQEYAKTHTTALEGQFEEGQKTGIWVYYGEDQKLKSVKYFDRGVEKTPPAEAQKKIDLIIVQKSGQLINKK